MNITASNYPKALEALQRRYGCLNEIVQRHHYAMLDIKPVRNQHDHIGNHSIQVNIASLKSLGQHEDQFANNVTPIVLRCLPPVIKTEINKEMYDSNDLTKLLDLLEKDVRGRPTWNHKKDGQVTTRAHLHLNIRLLQLQLSL